MYETLVVMVKCLGYPGTDTFEMSVPVYPSILRSPNIFSPRSDNVFGQGNQACDVHISQ